jgi:hypothetical protein
VPPRAAWCYGAARLRGANPAGPGHAAGRVSHKASEALLRRGVVQGHGVVQGTERPRGERREDQRGSTHGENKRTGASSLKCRREDQPERGSTQGDRARASTWPGPEIRDSDGDREDVPLGVPRTWAAVQRRRLCELIRTHRKAFMNRAVQP